MNLSLGTHWISLKVQDAAGVWSEKVTQILIIHRRPTVNITHIIPNPVNHSEYVTLYSWPDDDGYVSVYKWTSSIDGVLYDAPGSGFGLDNLSIGNHTITLIVQDNYGAWSEPVSAYVEVVEVIEPVIYIFPILTIQRPDNHSVVSGIVRVSGSLKFVQGVAGEIQVSIDDGPWIKANGTSAWGYKFDSTNLTDGYHYINIRTFHETYSSNVTTLLVMVRNNDDGDGDEGGGKEEKGFIPGFGLEMIGISLIVVIFLKRRLE